MVNFSTPYAMDGTIIPGEGLRRQQQDVSGAGSGVVRAGDLKIVPLDQPGQGIKIMPGHDLIQCRAPGRDRETYGVQLNAAANWMGDSGSGIVGTGSTPPTGRRDMIIHEILDPALPRHFTPQANWPPGATSKLSVVQNVAANATRVDQVPELADVTCYEVAAINWPPSTGTITLAMLEDLRLVQSPFTKRVQRAIDLTATQRLYTTNPWPAGGQTFPDEFTGEAGRLAIPLRATHAWVTMTWGGVRLSPSLLSKGSFWVQLGQNVHPDVQRTPAGSFEGQGARDTWTRGALMKIPASMRGTDQWFFPRANLDSAIAEAQQPFVNTTSSIILDVDFFEDAV